MFEEQANVTLDIIELVQAEIGIRDAEEIAAFSVFINEDALALLDDLGFDLEEPFAFEHGSEDEAGGAVFGLIRFDQFAEKRFGIFLLDRIRWRGDGRVVFALPIGNKAFAIGGSLAELRGPAFGADVQAFVSVFLVVKQRMKHLFFGEGLAASLAGVSTALNIPINHEFPFKRRSAGQ